CRACRCWNLVPLEERWEAMEEAAERFRASSRRVNSDEISLAFHNDGAGLLHVGRPTLPEFAAWRYGSKLIRRRDRFRRSAGSEAGAVGLGAGASLGAAGAVAALGAARGAYSPRLGLEISLHEASERKALAGDLADLTSDWRQAELVAEIADNLLLPESLPGRLEQLRRRPAPRNTA